MTPEFVRERLFKPFQTTKPTGMGIGVYESSQYVAGLGGSIAVESEPGVGRTVPRCLSRWPSLSRSRARRLRGMTDERRPLLIVEDDPALQKQMQWAFDKYETIVASDRESAIAQLRRYEPAVVTMDLGLPPHPDDPAEGLQAAGGDPRARAGTKVIVLTGQNDRANALKAISLGAHDFCTKPFEPELLTWAIDRAFRVHDLQTENARSAGDPGIAGDGGHHHPRSGDVADLPHHREGCAFVRDGPDPRRIGDRQGVACPGRARSVARGDGRSSRSTARRFPTPCSRASSSATRRGLSPGAAKQTLGQIEIGERRDDLPRRDRRHADVAAGQAPALPAGAGDLARRRTAGDPSTFGSSPRRTRA